MKNNIFIIALLLVQGAVAAQKNKQASLSFYLYDANWKPSSVDEAKFLGCLEKLSDTAWQWKYYNFKGPLLSIETYKDAEANLPHGYFAWFDSKGNIDSSGQTFEGKKHGTWLYFTDTLSVWQTEKYERGILIERKDSVTLRKEREKSDTTYSYPDEKEATFKGGEKAWIKYLQSRLQFPDRAQKMGIAGRVDIAFMVGNDGSIQDIRIHRSVEYSLDEEAIRLIKQSPKWEPAFQNGRHVKACRRQPITFAF